MPLASRRLLADSNHTVPIQTGIVTVLRQSATTEKWPLFNFHESKMHISRMKCPKQQQSREKECVQQKTRYATRPHAFT